MGIQVLATWEEYTVSGVTSPRTRPDQSMKETTVEQDIREDPTETGLGAKGTQDESLVREVSTLEDDPMMKDEDDRWMEEIITVGKYKEDDRKEIEDDQEDDLGEEDDLWVSQLYTDVDYSLLDTPTNLNGRTVVTSLEGWSRSGTLVEFQTPPKERRVVSSHLETESSVETADLISISPDSALVDSQGYTPARNGETLAMDTDRRKYTEGI